MRYRRSEIYLDHAATTAILPEVYDSMQPYLRDRYGNASASYALAEKSASAIQSARETIAQCIHAKPEEIFFTSGGSESDNWALKGAVDAWQMHHRVGLQPHIITTPIEHHAILNPLAYLQQKGTAASFLPVDKEGKVQMETLSKLLRPQTVLISVMYANNEIGTLQPIEQIGKWAAEHEVLFHTDAVQAFGHLPINVDTASIDMLSASGHKLGGPKGIGFLYIRKREEVQSFIQGGGQEAGMRAGTENVAAIVGLKTAARLADIKQKEKIAHLLAMRNYLAENIVARIPECRLNGARLDTPKQWEETGVLHRLPGNLNLTIPGVLAAELLAGLDARQICVSTASACSKHNKAQSHVLRSIGLTEEEARSTIRLTLGLDNTMMQMRYVAEQIAMLVKQLQQK